MNAFQSSEGYTVLRAEDGGVVALTPLGTKMTGGGPIAKALGEYVDHLTALHDTELGRWRWPENPDYVVYTDAIPGGHRVLRESDGASVAEGISRSHPRTNNYFSQAAWAFFDAHPEPTPWDDAKVDEIWAVTLHGTEKLCRVVKPAFHDDIPIAFLPIDAHGATWFKPSPSITAARRIWPEDAS